VYNEQWSAPGWNWAGQRSGSWYKTESPGEKGKGGKMTGPSLYTVFEYLATLVSEREPDEPFLLSQVQQAIRYKYPEFSFGDYQMAGIKEFLIAGEKAGYFKLVNTGNIQTAHLASGTKPVKPSVDMDRAAADPRRSQWMTLALESMLIAERADQLLEAMRHVEALSPEFDAFLAAEGKAARLYPVRGKIQRVRDFLKTCRKQGESQAVASWKASRTVLRMPPIPPVRNAAAAQSLIWSLLQGNNTLDRVPIESLDNLFFAVLAFSREQMERNKSWDWVIGLNFLEAEARAIPRPAPLQKRGLFGGKQQPVPSNELDEAEISSLVAMLRDAAGTGKSKAAGAQTWQTFAQAPNLDAAYRLLAEDPGLVQDEDMLNWLDDQIGQNVAAGAMDAVRNLANKSALLIAARQFGLEQLPRQSAEIRSIYDSVIAGAQLLGVLFGFLDAPTTDEAVEYGQQHGELSDEGIGPLFDDQALKAAREDDLERYRRVTDRADLWRNLSEFGLEEGLRQHERYLAAPRSDETIQAEVGILLLTEAKTTEECQDVIGRYPPVATDEALAMVNHMLDALSFQNADLDQYNRYHDVKRLIERCLELGVDRALAELK
jgi:hypothetical protein